MSVVQDAVQAVMKKAIALAPDGWIPGGHPDACHLAPEQKRDLWEKRAGAALGVA